MSDQFGFHRYHAIIAWQNREHLDADQCPNGQARRYHRRGYETERPPTARTTVDDVAMARAIHVLAIVFWIGGVAMVTTVLLPAVRRFKASEERVAFFDAVERRFARQARLTTALAGLSGLYMLYQLDLWDRF